MKKPNRNPTWYIFSICLVMYIFSVKGYLEIPDSFYSLETAQAIATEGHLQIPYSASYTSQGPGSRSYSKYGFGLVLYYLPVVAAGEAVVKGSGGDAALFDGFLLSFANIPFVILALLVFDKLLRRFEVPRVFAAICLLGLGLGTLAWRYACYGFSEGMQMGLLLLTVYALIRRTPRAIIAGGLAFAWLFLVKQVYVAYLPVLLIYLITRPEELRGRIRKTALFLFPLLLAGGFDLWLNFVRFGSPFESGYGNEASEFYPAQMWRTLPLLLGSLDKGLLIYCPILVLGFFGWRAFARQHRAEAALCCALIAENLLIAAAWHSWEGGWSWGPRLLVPAIPLWLLPAAFLYERWQSRKLRWAIATAVIVSAVTQIPGVLVSDREIHIIRQGLLTPSEQASAPSDYVAAWILLKHKLVDRNEIYRTSELHVPGDREVNLSQEPMFAGLNLWTERIAPFLKGSYVQWYPILGLLLAGYWAFQLIRSLRTAP